MKKLLFVLAGALALAACKKQPQLLIKVTNPLEIERTNEIVEIEWQGIVDNLPGVTPDNVLVFTAEGEEIPSQAVYYDTPDEPQMLIFQATVAPLGWADYVIRTGTRSEYTVKTFGRMVPERFDDFAWENNRAAYRVYGKKLETEPSQMLATPGIDVWVKKTENMVIDAWYAGNDYHTDHGEGMDAYKVGKTLGGGSSAPFIDGKLWLGGNFSDYRVFDNGPLRVSFKLVYDPFQAGDHTVSAVKFVTLDADSYFTRFFNTYTGDFEKMPVAAGFPMHDVKGTATGDYFIAMTEALSDTKQPEVDGDLSLAIIMSQARESLEADGHLLIVTDVQNDDPFMYFAGSAWSQTGVMDIEAWQTIVEREIMKMKNPLTWVMLR